MANEITNTFKELVDRLKEENIPGGKLQSIFLLEGPVDEILENNNMPCLIYELISTGTQTETCIGGWAQAEFSVLLTIHTKVSNGYYNDEKTGILDMYQSVLNSIDVGGAALNGNGNWKDSPKYRIVSLEKTSLCYVYEIEVSLTSKKYQRGTL